MARAASPPSSPQGAVFVRSTAEVLADNRPMLAVFARAGWPAESDPDLLWLKPHLARLRSKVEGAGGPAIVAIRGVGYRIDVEDARAN